MAVRPCIDCGTPCNGTRCTNHQAARTASKRTAYTHPDYTAMKAYLDTHHVDCHWGCGRRATTPDHLVPIINGGAFDRTNLVPACAPCNYGRRG